MKRENMQKIIKFRSIWKVDKRKGNYKLPNGERLSVYLGELLREQMTLDSLLIASDGNLYTGTWTTPRDAVIMIPFGKDESTTLLEHERRCEKLIREML